MSTNPHQRYHTPMKLSCSIKKEPWGIRWIHYCRWKKTKKVFRIQSPPTAVTNQPNPKLDLTNHQALSEYFYWENWILLFHLVLSFVQFRQQGGTNIKLLGGIAKRAKFFMFWELACIWQIVWPPNFKTNMLVTCLKRFVNHWTVKYITSACWSREKKKKKKLLRQQKTWARSRGWRKPRVPRMCLLTLALVSDGNGGRGARRQPWEQGAQAAL